MTLNEERSAIWGRFYATARTIAQRDRITGDAAITAIAYRLRREAFIAAIEPYLRRKADVLALRIPKLLLGPDIVVTETNGDIERAASMWDEMIAHEAKRFGVELS